jgi:hypothetical protein
MRQSDGILSRFPGPVTLYVSLPRRLLGLAVCVAAAAFFAWLLFAEYPKQRGYTSGWYDMIVASIGMMGSGALVIRAVILLLSPRAASLTLDANGFEIGHVFHRSRRPWRGVSDFQVKTRYRRGRLQEIIYDDLVASAEHRGGAKVTRVLPELYGRPRLHGDEFAGLMNEWRRRALAQPAPEPKSAVRHLRR